MASMISRAGAIVRRRGIGGLFRTVGRKLYDRHRSVWFDLPLDDDLALHQPKFDGRLDFENGDRVLAWIRALDIPGTADPVELTSMQRRGQLFVGVMDGDTIVGYIKLGWDTVYVLDYGEDLRLPAGDFFVIDFFVSPTMRGKGAGPFLVSAASIEMRRRGFTRGVMHVRTDKLPMLKTCARTGYREIGRVDYMSLLGRKILRPHPARLLTPGPADNIISNQR